MNNFSCILHILRKIPRGTVMLRHFLSKGREQDWLIKSFLVRNPIQAEDSTESLSKKLQPVALEKFEFENRQKNKYYLKIFAFLTCQDSNKKNKVGNCSIYQPFNIKTYKLVNSDIYWTILSCSFGEGWIGVSEYVNTNSTYAIIGQLRFQFRCREENS